jgi:hypothetical protein
VGCLCQKPNWWLGIRLLFSIIGRSLFKRSFSKVLDTMGRRLIGRKDANSWGLFGLLSIVLGSTLWECCQWLGCILVISWDACCGWLFGRVLLFHWGLVLRNGVEKTCVRWLAKTCAYSAAFRARVTLVILRGGEDFVVCVFRCWAPASPLYGVIKVFNCCLNIFFCFALFCTCVVSVRITVEWSDERLSMIWLFRNFVMQKSTKSGSSASM